jgi:ABC-type multidrug transport system fused ATPase/permease subunit
MDPRQEAAVPLPAAEGGSRNPEITTVDISPSPADQGPSKIEDPDEQQFDYSSKAENRSTWSDYMRIFTYSTLTDRILLGIAFFAEIATGCTLPLMNIIFGHLATHFSAYFTFDSTTTKEQFLHILSQQTIYIVYLFIGRWVLSYISMLIFRMTGLRISAKLRSTYLKALFSLPVQTLDTLPSGQASNTITSTANVVQAGISDRSGYLIICLFAYIIVQIHV